MSREDKLNKDKKGVIMKKEEKGICPLCGRENRCASVLGTDPHSCWCMTAKVPKELIDMVPEEKKGNSCICQKCVEDWKEQRGEKI